MIKPITPSEAKKKKSSSIPSWVIKGFNDIIAETIDLTGESTFTMDEVIKKIMKTCPREIKREELFDKGWLDVEPLYRAAGWKVEFDKPAYNEDYDASFTFKSK